MIIRKSGEHTVLTDLEAFRKIVNDQYLAMTVVSFVVDCTTEFRTFQSNPFEVKVDPVYEITFHKLIDVDELIKDISSPPSKKLQRVQLDFNQEYVFELRPESLCSGPFRGYVYSFRNVEGDGTLVEVRIKRSTSRDKS